MSEEDRLRRFARIWSRAIRPTTATPLPEVEFEECLVPLVRRLCDALRTVPLDTQPAYEVGQALVAAQCYDAGGLPLTLGVLDAYLVLYCPPDRPMPAEESRARCARLQHALAAGFAHALSERAKGEQESVSRQALAARAAAEQALHASEARFQAVFDGAVIGVGVADLNGHVLLVNDAVARMFGRPGDHLLGENVVDWAHPQDIPAAMDIYHELITGQREHFRMEKPYYRGDGSVLWTNLTVTLLRDETGAPQYQLALMEDVTEQRRLHDRLRYEATHDELTGLPNRALFFECLDEAVATLDGGGSSSPGRPGTSGRGAALDGDWLRDGGVPALDGGLARGGEPWDDGVTADRAAPSDGSSVTDLTPAIDSPSRPRDASAAPQEPVVIPEPRPAADGRRAAPHDVGADGLDAHTGPGAGPADPGPARVADPEIGVVPWSGAAYGPDSGGPTTAAPPPTPHSATASGPATDTGPGTHLGIGPSTGRGPLSADPSDRFGMCYVDLDGFRAVNDSLGHVVGDHLLSAVAERLQACAVSPYQIVARPGGDEFFALTVGPTAQSDVMELAERMLEALAEPVRIKDRDLLVRASIGVASGVRGETTRAAVLRSVDIAMYRAKAAGGNRYEVADAASDARVIARHSLTNGLPAALEKGEFFIEYQPLVSLEDGSVRGAEALVRWLHPVHGVLGPDQFIALAENTGLIVPLGRWVLTEAARQARAWREAGYDGAPLRVNVNLSPCQLRYPDLVADTVAVLDDAGLDPAALCLEVTENDLIGADEEALRPLRQLADLGVDIALDDFGTGYSNLAYLRRLPVSTLKLDRSFTLGMQRDPADPVDVKIVEGIVSLAHTLDLAVTVEGVETGSQAEHLRLLGCDTAQGWYYARPGPPDRLHQLALTDVASG
ncbi:EAL domain-containing protein [Streptomyces zagrosensis]|uniref:Diguanylate cyclase (GGDEF)-like protein/PAS domain S-box-containing protein n=1 Tax=Streptomyces zagrosensis TaxID=1042984 RepID=A0A7W9Q8E6_9ACTN|nr:EAL domain-containing protein [Streptomyces zagrosensis]MBB5935509.1 diguanylate cyclase (GGDEF)-like protein/PAS domain S-box-containing protein [Streptomyces zagrosensis]